MTSAPTPERTPPQKQEIVLAKWSTRFWAWLLDFIIVMTAAEIIFSLAYAPLVFHQGMQNNPGLGAIKYAVQSLMFFGYWTYFESTSGQSIGKKLLKIKTADLEGNIADAKSVAISRFGKAFILPIDMFFGWIFTYDKRQRLMGRASNTIVEKAVDTNGSQSVSYRKN